MALDQILDLTPREIKRLKALTPSGTSRQELAEAEAGLDPDQVILRTVCQYVFCGNQAAMGRAMGGITGPSVRKYIITGKSRPAYETMQVLGKSIGLTVDQIRAIGKGELFVVGSGDWIGGDTPKDAQKRLDIISKMVTADPAADLDDV